MSLQILFFIVIGAVALAAAAGVVASRHPVHSALFLLTHFAMLAVMYITLDAQFLAAIQVIVYAGGIVILILFVIMLIGSGRLDSPDGGEMSWIPYIAMGLGVILLGGLTYSMQLGFDGIEPNPAALEGGVPQAVGKVLFTQHILAFELVSVLLLVALIGALLLARGFVSKT